MATKIETSELGTKTGWSLRIFDQLFGYDYFIAHRSVDGKIYAAALYDALTGKGNELECFLDVKHHAAGGDLTKMQTRALRKTSRIIVIVTPRAHENEANHLHSEVAEFRRFHPRGIVVPIGAVPDLTKDKYPESRLWPIVPHYPASICILQSPEQLREGKPSADAVAKLLNDFSEERQSTRRLRSIQRFAALLAILLSTAIIISFYAAYEASEAKRELQVSTAQRLTAEAINLQDRRPDLIELATLLCAEAARRSPSAQVNEGLRTAVAKLAARNGALQIPNSVLPVQFSPDGCLCAAACADGQIRLWNTFTGTRRGSDIPLTKNNNFALSNKAEIVEADGSIVRVWNLDQSREPLIVISAAGPVTDVGISTSGRYIYATIHNLQASIFEKYVWELKGGEAISKIQAPSGNFVPDRCLFSPDERWFAITPFQGIPEIWNLQTGSMTPPVEPQMDPLHASATACFSDDGSQFAFATFPDHTIHVWNLDERKITTNFKWTGVGVALAFSHDGTELAAASASGLCIWNVANGDETIFIANCLLVNSVVFSANDQLLLTHCEDGTFRIWNTRTGLEINRIAMGPDFARQLGYFDSSSRLIAAQSEKNRIQMWRIGQGDTFSQVDLKGIAGLTALAHSNDYLAVASAVGDVLRVWKIDDSANVEVFENKGGGRLAISPQATYVAASQNAYTAGENSATASAWVYELTTGRRIAQIDHQTVALGISKLNVWKPGKMMPTSDLRIALLEFSPSGNRLATESSDGTIVVTQLPNGHRIFQQKLAEAPLLMAFTTDDQLVLVNTEGSVISLSVRSGQSDVVSLYDKSKKPLALSADGQFLAVLGNDTNVEAMDLRHDRDVLQIPLGGKGGLGIGNGVLSREAVFSHDNRYLAVTQHAVNRYATIQIWDTITHLEVADIALNQADPGVTFSPDSHYLVVPGDLTTIRWWQTNDLLQIAGQRLSGNLSPDAWKFYLGNEPPQKTFSSFP